MAAGGLTCECGALIREGMSCEAVYHEILATEQLDATLARWHTVVVCAYVLQHPSQGTARYRDGQFRMLQLYRNTGLDAQLRVAAHQRARNRHSVRSGYSYAPLEQYAALPDREPPTRFAHGFPLLSDLIGDVGRERYLEYERRLDAIVDATIDAWSSGNIAKQAGK